MSPRGAHRSADRLMKNRSSVLGDLGEFGTLHRPHGVLTADAGKRTANGYRLEVTCACGAVFKRWVSSGEHAM
jgi:hypothetical protein